MLSTRHAYGMNSNWTSVKMIYVPVTDHFYSKCDAIPNRRRSWSNSACGRVRDSSTVLRYVDFISKLISKHPVSRSLEIGSPKTGRSRGQLRQDLARSDGKWTRPLYFSQSVTDVLRTRKYQIEPLNIHYYQFDQKILCNYKISV